MAQSQKKPQPKKADPKLIADHRQSLKEHAAKAARVAAAADPTDPFIYNRVYSRIVNGVGEEYAYEDRSHL